MKGIPYIPDTAPFSPEQRAWLNGFLAGLMSNIGPAEITAPQPSAAPSSPLEPLLILFGSQTGSAEGLAKRAAKEAGSRGFAPRVLALNDCEQAALAQGGKVVVISSTYGDGDPPDNAVNFWFWLNSSAAPRLEKLQFAVLGLGDKNYADFCGASKKFDARLEALGARRLLPRGECDTDYEAPARQWLDSLWKNLMRGEGAAPDSNGHALPSLNGNGHQPAEKAAFSKTNPFSARLLKNVCLNKPGSGKEVWHHEISLEGGGVSYEVGDALGVVPLNCPALVQDLLALLRCQGSEVVKVGDAEMPLHEALLRHLEITKPTPDLLDVVARRAPGCELASLLTTDRASDLKKWLWGRDVIDLLRLLPEPLSATEFVPALRKLAPRLYSIASSPKAHPEQAHLCVGAVRYQSHGRDRSGVASTFLADRLGAEEHLKVFVQPSPSFKPPTNGDTPMIMVGPGTGIAPFRAFLEERQAIGAKGKNWLFFGDQRRSTDFLYEEQLTGWVKDQHLTRLDLAFSRDQQEKIYVQDRMLENASELWSWLDAGAHFYVCGEASRMAADVDAALHKVIETRGGKSADEARTYVARLRSERRYQRDVY
jgi:sulfite reductase (NADPH) flavoprotein alpha-component